MKNKAQKSIIFVGIQIVIVRAGILQLASDNQLTAVVKPHFNNKQTDLRFIRKAKHTTIAYMYNT